jgi:hypothetical protein
MAIPQVTCNSDIELNYSVSSQVVSLGANATGLPFSWRWDILSVPSGSTANIGVNGNFIDGVAFVQNPSLTLTAGIDGGYVFQCIATNTNGSSNPEVDKENSQQQVIVRTQKYNLKLTGDFSRKWGGYLRDFTLRVIETVLYGHVTSTTNPHGTNFLNLTDTPDSYADKAGKSVGVKTDLSGLEFITIVTTDEKAKITTNDTTTAYLDSKLVAANGIQKSILTPSGNEQLQLSPTYGDAVNTVCQGNDSRLADDRIASGLRTATTVVNVSAATAPTAGQILAATNGTAATWIDMTGAEIFVEETKIDDSSTTKILAYTPILSKSSPSGYTLEVYRNGLKMKWVSGSPATVDEYQYTSVSKTVTYVSEVDSFYQFIYWTDE